MSNLAPAAKIDPLRGIIRSGSAGVTVVTAGEPGWISTGMGGSWVGMKIGDRS